MSLPRWIVAFSCLPLVALAQVAPAVPQQREVDLQATDGGFVTRSPAAVDDGVAQAPILPPVLQQDSRAIYPEALLHSREGGQVTLELLIGESGTVEEAAVVKAAHPLMDEAAVTAARGLRFLPATQADRPVSVRIHFEYLFEPPPAPPPAPATIAGVVREKGTRRPIAGATVHAEGVEEPVAEADADGRFVAQVPAGQRWLRVMAPGQKTGAFRETLDVGERVEVVYALEPLAVNPYETIVRDERPRTEISRITLREQEIREVPGTQGDPFRVVMLMPGVSSVASGVSYPVVRGAQPAATGYFIDGVRVPVLFHLLLGPAVIHPDFIDAVDFHPGVAPVRYGRLLGGAVEGQVSRPREDRPHASAYADLINAGGFVEAPIAATGTNVTLSGRYSYTPWLLALASNEFTRPDPEGYRTRAVADFWDYQGRIEQKVGAGKLRLLAFGSSDRVGSDNENPKGLDAYLFTTFHRVDLRYRHAVGVGEGEVGVTWGIEQLGVLGERGEDPLGEYALRARNVAARLSWSAKLTDAVTFAFGGDIDHRRASASITGEYGTSTRVGPGEGEAFQHPLTLSTMAGAWTELQWKVTDKLLLVPGLRLDNYHLVPGIDHLAFDPRLTARYALRDDLTLKAGAALLHQPPTVLLNLPVMDTAGLRHGLQEAVSLDVGAEWRVGKGLEFSADAYYTRLTRAVEFTLVDVLQDTRRRGISTRDPGRLGYAWGLELMARHPLGDRWFGWVSYAFQQSRRLTTFSRYDDDERILETTTAWLPFAFEQTHVANAAVSYKFANNLTVGTVLHFNTGRPESGELSSRTFRKASDAAGNERWVFQDRDRVEKLPPFFRVDLRVSYARTFEHVIAEAYLDVLNVTMSREVLGYNYYKGPEGEPDELQGFDPDAPMVLKRDPVAIPMIVPILGAKVTW